MKKILECVPNISIGDNPEKIQTLLTVFDNKANVRLLSAESDKDYNRTVITLVGESEALIEAVVDLAKACVKHLDLNHHRGSHARMGALDVVPFIPLAGMTLDEADEVAKECAKRISEETNIPTYLYAHTARKPEREKLPDIRKGEFEGFFDKMQDPIWAPDFGPSIVHPTAGVTAVGARPLLIAYNIDLSTSDEKVASNIAKAIRGSSGGYKHVQAGPAYLATTNHVQVTMNILDYKQNPMYRIFETVKFEAKQYGVEVISSEIVGLISKDALLRSLKYYQAIDNASLKKDIAYDELVHLAKKHLLLRDFDVSKIIEYHFEEALS